MKTDGWGGRGGAGGGGGEGRGSYLVDWIAAGWWR